MLLVNVLFAPVLLALVNTLHFVNTLMYNLVSYVVYLCLFLGLFKNIKYYIYCLYFYNYVY